MSHNGNRKTKIVATVGPAGTVALIDRRARFTGFAPGLRSDHSGEFVESGRDA